MLFKHKNISSCKSRESKNPKSWCWHRKDVLSTHAIAFLWQNLII